MKHIDDFFCDHPASHADADGACTTCAKWNLAAADEHGCDEEPPDLGIKRTNCDLFNIYQDHDKEYRHDLVKYTKRVHAPYVNPRTGWIGRSHPGVFFKRVLDPSL